jgi:hypothetical protein
MKEATVLPTAAPV